jgi:FHA domain
VNTIAIVALETDETLLILKIAFLVLLYGFIVLVVRSATKGMDQAPQESIVLGAAEAAALRAEHGFKPTRLLVVTSPELAEGATIEVSAPTVVGRDAQSGIRLDHDEYVSSRHARIEPRQEGAWVDDLGSTNGTFVN